MTASPPRRTLDRRRTCSTPTYAASSTYFARPPRHRPAGRLTHTTPVFVGTHDDQLIFFTGPRSRKARNLRRDPRVALSLAPADNPFQPVIIRGRVTEWLEGDTAWEIIDQIATKYTGPPTPETRNASSPSSSPTSRPSA